MDMWAAYANLVREHATNAEILFDRFHIVKHLNEAVDAVRRVLWRHLTTKERATFKGTRWLLLKNLKLRRMLGVYDEQLRAAEKTQTSYSFAALQK